MRRSASLAMANFLSVSAVGKSLERLLNACFERDKSMFHKQPKAVLVRAEDLDVGDNQASIITPPALSIFVHRLEVNATMRAAWSGVSELDGQVHLPLDLHVLLTAWDDNAEWELQILGRAMLCLETTPILSGPLLHPSGGWAPNESVQVVTDDMSGEAIMRTFESLSASFRLSVPYIARVVRLAGPDPLASPGVTTAVAGLRPIGGGSR
jgi:Pvc16 N-terminal domain